MVSDLIQNRDIAITKEKPSSRNDNIDDYITEIRKNINELLLIPRVYLSGDKTIKNAHSYYLYVKYPYPLFLIQPLYETFCDAFIRNGIDPDSKFKNTAGKMVDRIKIKNKKIYSIKGSVKNIKDTYLLVRWKEKRMSFKWHARNLSIWIYRNSELVDEPCQFVYDVLKYLDYPYYVIKDAIINDKLDVMTKVLRRIELNNARGWKIDL